MLRFCSSAPVTGLGTCMNTFARRPQQSQTLGLAHRLRHHTPSGRPCTGLRMAKQAALGHAEGLESGLPPGFNDKELQNFRLAVVGDLHLVPDQMQTFETAQQHLNDVLLGSQHSSNGTGRTGRPVGRLVQLGDLGGYEVRPGSMTCFETAKHYLAGFPCPQALITGNHDLEGSEFETDEQNLEAWKQVFQQRHYWAAEVGPAVLVGLSTVRFRSNPDSVHEVHIDDEQLDFLRETLQKAGARPVLMFTHAPPMGSGLKVLPTVHVKNRCAWVNHSSNPGVFIQLVRQHPNIKLWFSGHFHLSHDYHDSLSHVGQTTFVSTGVIGDYNRDGCRHSRFLEGDQHGFRLYTMDHLTGKLRLDLQRSWNAPGGSLPSRAPLPVPVWQQLQKSLGSRTAAERASSGREAGPSSQNGDGDGLSSHRDNGSSGSPDVWLRVGRQSLLCLQDVPGQAGCKMLVEYDPSNGAAVGVVLMKVTLAEQHIVLVDAGGREVFHLSQGSVTGSGLVEVPPAAAIELRAQDGTVKRRRVQNGSGGFFHIYQQNKWQLRLQRDKQQAVAKL